MKNRICSFILMFILLLTLAVNASASHVAPDLTHNGSITFVMQLNDQLLDGGNLNVYKVGDIAEEDGNYGFCLIDELQDSDIALDNVNDPELAAKLLTVANVDQKITKPIAEGVAVFSDLPVGLYLVWQNDQNATQGFAPIQPFLISVPQFQDGEYELDVNAKPKVPLKTLPQETVKPTPTPDQSLPQTGQLNWPIPVMALSGVVLFIVGWILCAGKRRTGHER